MNRKLWLLSLILPITVAMLPQPAPAAGSPTCGSGTFFTTCTRTCVGPGVMTTFSANGRGSSCTAAHNACATCLPACPSGQSQTGLHQGACSSAG